MKMRGIDQFVNRIQKGRQQRQIDNTAKNFRPENPNKDLKNNSISNNTK